MRDDYGRSTFGDPMPPGLLRGARTGRRLLGAGAAVVAALTVGQAGCREVGAKSSGAGKSGRPRVVCTIGMITDAARAIAGEHAEVVGLMGEYVDPHLYKATQSDLRLLREADLILYNGLHLEGRMGDVFVQMARDKPVIPVAASVDESRLREPPEFEGQYDPHVWFDVSLWSQAVARIRDELVQLCPANKEEMTRRAQAYLTRLSELDAYCRSQIASIPRERRVLITAHDAFGYFGRSYDIEVLAIQGISTESEANIRKVNELVDTISRRKIPAVFVESSVNPKLVESLVQGCAGRGHAVHIGGELFSDAMGKDGTPEGTYEGMVRHNVDTIVKALK